MWFYRALLAASLLHLISSLSPSSPKMNWKKFFGPSNLFEREKQLIYPMAQISKIINQVTGSSCPHLKIGPQPPPPHVNSLPPNANLTDTACITPWLSSSVNQTYFDKLRPIVSQFETNLSTTPHPRPPPPPINPNRQRHVWNEFRTKFDDSLQLIDAGIIPMRCLTYMGTVYLTGLTDQNSSYHIPLAEYVQYFLIELTIKNRTAKLHALPGRVQNSLHLALAPLQQIETPLNNIAKCWPNTWSFINNTVRQIGRHLDLLVGEIFLVYNEMLEVNKNITKWQTDMDLNTKAVGSILAEETNNWIKLGSETQKLHDDIATFFATDMSLQDNPPPNVMSCLFDYCFDNPGRLKMDARRGIIIVGGGLVFILCIWGCCHCWYRNAKERDYQFFPEYHKRMRKWHSRRGSRVTTDGTGTARGKRVAGLRQNKIQYRTM